MADSVKVNQTTTSGTIYWRGNRFYGHLDIENTSNGNMNIGYNPADSCFAGLSLTGRRIRWGYAHPDNYVQGDVVINSTGSSGTSIAVSGGSTASGAHIDGDIIIDKTGTGSIGFASVGTTPYLTMTAGHSIMDGATGYLEGVINIKGLEQQGTGGGISFTAGADDQNLNLIGVTTGPNIGSLTLDVEDVTIDGAVVNRVGSVAAAHLSLENSDFMSATAFTKTGSGNDLDNGGNRFYGPLSVTLSAPNDMHFAFTNPDTAFSTIQLKTTTSQNLVLGEYADFVTMGNVYCNEESGSIILGGPYGGDFTIAGPGVQTLALEQGNEVASSKITVNKPSGYCRLTGTMDVSGSLTLTDGVIQTVDSGLVVIQDNATVSGASDDSHVEGPVLKEGNDAFTFPIGRNGIYQPLTITAPVNTSHAFKAEYFDEDSDPMYDHSSAHASINYLDRTQYWTFEKISGTTGVYLTMGWRDVDCGIASINDPDICSWSGTQWNNRGNDSPTGTVVTGTATTAKSTGESGPYTWGNFSGIKADAGPDRVMETGDTVTIGVMTQENWDYDWTPSGTVEQADTAITRAWPTTKTEYVLEVEGENSCTATDTAVVFITVMPEDTAHSSLDFVVNNGQIIDTDGAPREDIDIYSHQANPMVYCADNRVSFVHSKIDTLASTPDTLARLPSVSKDTPKPSSYPLPPNCVDHSGLLM
jgi:hypothetical protein